MTTGKPRVLATRHFPPDVEARLAANFDAVLNPDDRLHDGSSLIKAAAGCDGIMCAAGDPLNGETIAGLPASICSACSAPPAAPTRGRICCEPTTGWAGRRPS